MDTVLIILSSILVISFFSSDVNCYEECYRTQFHIVYCETGHCCVNNTKCCATKKFFTLGRIIGLVIAGIVGLVLVCGGIYGILTRSTKNKRKVTPTQETEVTATTTEQEISNEQALDIPANEPPRYEQITNKQAAPEQTQNQHGDEPEAQIDHGETTHQQHDTLQPYSGDLGPNYVTPSPLPPPY